MIDLISDDHDLISNHLAFILLYKFYVELRPWKYLYKWFFFYLFFIILFLFFIIYIFFAFLKLCICKYYVVDVVSMSLFSRFQHIFKYAKMHVQMLNVNMCELFFILGCYNFSQVCKISKSTNKTNFNMDYYAFH